MVDNEKFFAVSKPDAMCIHGMTITVAPPDPVEPDLCAGVPRVARRAEVVHLVRRDHYRRDGSGWQLCNSRPAGCPPVIRMAEPEACLSSSTTTALACLSPIGPAWSRQYQRPRIARSSAYSVLSRGASPVAPAS